jgi:hypothetical protein
VTEPGGSRASRLLLWAAYASALVGLLLGFNERSAVAGLRWVTLFSVGIMGVIIFARRLAIMMEGAAGDDGPMQIGLAHLAWGLVAIVLIRRQSSAPGLIAVSLVFAVYLALSAGLRLATVMTTKDRRPAASDLAGVVIVAALAVAIGWFAVAALHVRPA